MHNKYINVCKAYYSCRDNIALIQCTEEIILRIECLQNIRKTFVQFSLSFLIILNTSRLVKQVYIYVQICLLITDGFHCALVMVSATDTILFVSYIFVFNAYASDLIPRLKLPEWREIEWKLLVNNSKIPVCWKSTRQKLTLRKIEKKNG